MNTFEQELIGRGFMPKAVVPDGKIRRCRTEAKPNRENGWYVLHPDGRGVYGDWTTGSSEPIGRWNGECGRYDPRAIEQMRERRQQEKREAIRAARAWWRGCRPVRSHPYLRGKGLSPLPIMRERDGQLVSPVMGQCGLMSIQTIDGEGEKRFWPNAPVRGGSVVLERKAPVTVFCEGLATGLAIYQSIKMVRVVVAYFADNIAPVIRATAPEGSVVIAADNDWRTGLKTGRNPGVEKARAIADEIGCGLAYPVGIDGTDWADWIQEIGDRAASLMQQQLLSNAKYVVRC
jgi:putative DNA primase/helicase